MNNSDTIKQLKWAESQAEALFGEIIQQQLMIAGKKESQLNNEIFQLAEQLFGIKKYWHKRIVRAGSNTLLPYRDNPPDRTIAANDILFLDFGPVFEEFEADYGRTYVIGEDERKLKLKRDVETAWHEGRQFYQEYKEELRAADFFGFTKNLASENGWEYGGPHCGHLIGKFPHEKIQGDQVTNYLHPGNPNKMNDPGADGNDRCWIYEIHFIDKKEQIGGFFEQLLT